MTKLIGNIQANSALSNLRTSFTIVVSHGVNEARYMPFREAASNELQVLIDATKDRTLTAIGAAKFDELLRQTSGQGRPRFPLKRLPSRLS